MPGSENMEHVSQVIKSKISRRFSAADIEARAFIVVGALLPEIPAGHRGRWRYNSRTRMLVGRVTHSAIAVTLQLRAPEIRQALAAEFPGLVKEISVRLNPFKL